jgi:hypothetical protein
MLRRRHYVAVGVLAILSFVRPAGAVYHVAVIDEVLTSYGGDPTAQFIEINMLSSFQNAVTNSVLAAFDSSGAYINDILIVPGNVTNQGADVRWLVATTSLQTAAGITADFTMPSGILPTGGGMVCFGGGGGPVPVNPLTWSRTDFASYVDCVAYGTYSGPTNVHTGTPTTLNGDGHSLQRVGLFSTNNNSVDFTCGDPITPENNAPVTKTLAASSPCPPMNPTPTPTPTPGACPASPDGACLNSFAHGLMLVNEASGSQKLLVKMIGGPALMQSDLGNPLASGGTAYAVCIYDNLGGLVGHLSVDRAGDFCRGNPCWKALGGAPGGTGFKYKDGTLSSDGVSLILVKGGAAGQSKALVKAGGSSLPGGITAALQSSTNATVQLRGSDATQCLSVTLTNIKKQGADNFKAKK